MTFEMSLLLSIGLLLILLVTIYAYLLSCPKLSSGAKRISSDPLARLLCSSLESRAIPNQRLVTVFGIDNAFTTTDSAYHKNFVHDVKVLLRMQDGDWKSVADAALSHLGHAKIKIGAFESSSLQSIVQAFAFRMVLRHFFPEIHPPSDPDIRYITSSINVLWVLSKSCKCDQAELLNQKTALLSKLALLFDHTPFNFQGDRQNPLNVILPGYETLWRVVLRCFLEVRFRGSSSSHLRRVLLKFMSDPTTATFEARSELQDISAKDIILEALRLYPPTRRIYRKESNVLHAIDVECMHRDPRIWGLDALVFNPSRIKNMNKLAFIPFGKKRFSCPAENQFAPMMIAILVGALTTEIDEELELVDEDGEVVDLGLGALENGRDDYPGLRLQRRKNV